MSTEAAAPPTAPADRANVVVVGVVVAAVAGTMLFAGLLGSYLSLRDSTLALGAADWPAKSGDVNLPNMPLAMIGLTMVMMSVTALWVHGAARRQDRRNALVAVGLTLLLGAAVLNGVGFVMREMGLAAGESAYATFVWTLMGTFFVVVVASLVGQLAVGFRALGGQVGAGRTEAAAAAAALVLFAAAAWAAVYVSVFIVK